MFSPSPPSPSPSLSYQSVDGVGEQWGGGEGGGGPGFGHRMSAEEVKLQQQTIIAGIYNKCCFDQTDQSMSCQKM